MPHTSSKGIDGALARNILLGSERVVSHPGTSQFANGAQGAGTSACGLAVLNFARLVFEQEKYGAQNEDMLQIITSKRFFMDVTSICAGWTSDSHLEVEDISTIPLFDKTLRSLSTKYGRPGIDYFTELLRELETTASSAIAVITRPPEIIGCLKLATSVKDLFLIFDSHPRPAHPKGAGLTFNASLSSAAAKLADILPFDNRLLEHGELHWQAQLLANCSGHIFVAGPGLTGPTGNAEYAMQVVLESSLAILALRAEVADLRFQNSTLTSENQRLEVELEQIEERREERQRLRQSARGHHHAETPRTTQPYSPRDRNAAAGPSREHSDSYHRSPHSSANPNTRSDEKLAEQVQIDMIYGSDSTNFKFSDATAVQMQQRFDEEDKLLRIQREEFASQIQSASARQFLCSICLEEYSEENIVRLEFCDHALCRTCTKDYVSSKLEEHRFPILCPMCMADDHKGNPGTITDITVQQSGITNQQFDIWVELQMSQFSVLVHCRKCKGSAYVDRQDLEDTTLLPCPLPDCNYIWCKACQQSVVIGGAKHSCDGSSELDHLMKQRGWKYCPSQ
ncbi:hypothetical protein SERLADRAFT_443513 [Serpula lacrymans var. lacrymans S7.9]|uniref:RING-type domain-containing protein n=1 Tax=Serpula lacrymans var. lacrymans (strain S7.9) TaxID=578457 RepID=F8PCL5_SERL9|nr:uncharacterized protein SERLADRAFT_443513 [Serpula lacrymans var. lacrymans S7.9]EGO18967.1 hypothetical protein SERLADRAFT_443513 [Serpula lacrymans var. lacrymans S7.9]